MVRDPRKTGLPTQGGLTMPLAPSSASGARDRKGKQLPYQEDPERDRPAAYNGGGYMSTGYDTGRVW
jgi:hypothetical protein